MCFESRLKSSPHKLIKLFQIYEILQAEKMFLESHCNTKKHDAELQLKDLILIDYLNKETSTGMRFFSNILLEF